MTDTPCDLVGGHASPYSRKMLALMRYRRIPHRWHIRHVAELSDREAGKLRLMPMLRLPGDERYQPDSTPQAHALEARFPNDRSVLPPDPSDCFVCHLIEDFADEWCTKIMYHGRWGDLDGSRFGARLVIGEMRPDLDEATRAFIEAEFMARQRSRCGLVGCSPENAPVIDASFRDLLAAMQQLPRTAYLFGSRPSLADFALYGQLAQLSLDIVPQAQVRATAPGVEHWVMRLDDASGLTGHWDSVPGAGAREALLQLIGEIYLPFLHANARAIADGRETVSLPLRGQPFTQPVYKYQAKCLSQLLAHWQSLDAASRDALTPVLTRTGCLDSLNLTDPCA